MLYSAKALKLFTNKELRCAEYDGRSLANYGSYRYTSKVYIVNDYGEL
jgi:hypothetical protein